MHSSSTNTFVLRSVLIEIVPHLCEREGKKNLAIANLAPLILNLQSDFLPVYCIWSNSVLKMTAIIKMALIKRNNHRT